MCLENRWLTRLGIPLFLLFLYLPGLADTGIRSSAGIEVYSPVPAF